MSGVPGMLLFGTLLCEALLCGPAGSMEPDQTLAQMNRKSWKVWDGAPPDIHAAAQTEDGTLWLGSASGLYRFDGIHFVRYSGPPGQPFVSTSIYTLAAWPGEGLWIGFAFGGIAVLKNNTVLQFSERDGLPSATVLRILKDHDGSIWAVTGRGLAHLRGQRWQRIPLNPDLPIGSGDATIDLRGNLWVATTDAGSDRLFVRSGTRTDFREIVSLKSSGNAALAAAPDGTVWLAEDSALTRFDPLTTDRPNSRSFPTKAGASLLSDRQGHLWLGALNQSLRRMPLRLLSEGLSDAEVAQRVEVLGPERPDAPSNETKPLLEDREGNIWVATPGGLDRFNDSRVVTLDIPSSLGDRASEVESRDAAVVVDGSGTLWVALQADAPDTMRLLTIRDGVVVAQRDAPGFRGSAYRDMDGSLWFAGSSGLAHLEDGRLIPTAIPEDARHAPIQAIVRDPAGALWIAMLGRGVFRLEGGKWTLRGGLHELPESTPVVATTDPRRNLWFGYTHNRIARVHDSTVRVFGTADGLDVGTVTAISARADHVWIAGDLGFARLDGERFVPVRGASDHAFTGISGIVTTETGDLWLNGDTGISHIVHTEVEHALRDPSYQPQYEVFDYRDGLVGTATQIRPLPSAVESSEGRLWFCTTAGVVSIFPDRIQRNLLPPPVTIWSVSSGGRQYENVGEDLRLPAYTTQLQIAYTAASLTVPDRVRFRYQLEGSDHDWQEVGNRHEAVYTNLGPGRYNFRVVAANNDGVWNNAGAALQITISPAFTQTKLFYALCALLCLAALYALYTVRARQLASQVRGRLEARLAERERIARELHDTLLQGVQGLILRFQALAGRDVEQDRTQARAAMERALARADEVLAEARDRVKELRATAGEETDLPMALAVEGQQLNLGQLAQFRLSVAGTRRELHPIVREEIFLIAREALGNAFRHSGAQHIEAEFSYGDGELHVRIRDDGRGIHFEVLDAGGRPGHFGLLGMRERAERIHAQVKIWSKPGAGTEIDLRVPAKMAYRRPRTGTGCRAAWRWIAGCFSLQPRGLRD